MEVQVVESGPCRRSLTIKVPVDKIKQHVDGAFKSASQQVQIKGFRAGHVPRRVLEKKYGAEIMAEAKESLVSESFEEACSKNEIRFIGRPEVEGLDDAPLNPESPLEFQVHVEVKPDIKLERVKGIEVGHGDTEVTDEDVQAGLDQLANQKRSLRSVDEPAEDGDFVRGDMRFKVGDEVVLERKGAQLNTNIPIAGTDQEVFKNNLIGAEAGKSIVLDIKFPEKFEKEAVRGKDGKIEIDVQEVMRVTAPKIDDEFAKGFDFDSVDALRAEVRKRISEEKSEADERRIEGSIIESILMESPFEIPSSLVEDQKGHLLKQTGERMKEQGMDEETMKTELQKLEDEAAKEAEQRVRGFFLLEAIAKQEKIFVTEGDIDVELRNIAASNNASPMEVRTYYEENNLLDDLRWSIRERKVREFLRENAKITDK